MGTKHGLECLMNHFNSLFSWKKLITSYPPPLVMFLAKNFRRISGFIKRPHPTPPVSFGISPASFAQGKLDQLSFLRCATFSIIPMFCTAGFIICVPDRFHSVFPTHFLLSLGLSSDLSVPNPLPVPLIFSFFLPQLLTMILSTPQDSKLLTYKDHVVSASYSWCLKHAQHIVNPQRNLLDE